MIKHLQILFASMLMLVMGVNASAQDVVTFTFNEANSYEQFGLTGWSDGKLTDGDITENKSIKIGDVTFTVTPANGSTNTRMYKDYKGNFGLRSYGGTQFIISANRNITKIEFNASKFNFSAEAGTLTGTTWEPAGDMTTATFSCSKSSTTGSVTVTLAAGSVDPTPSETTELYSIVFDTKANIDTWTKEGFNADKWDFATLNDRNEGRLALYAYGNGEADSEILVTTYFVSPVIKLGENNTVSFNSTNNYYSDAFPVEKATALAIRTVGGEWVEIPGIKHGTNWVELVLTELQIPAEFNNKEVQFGFKYMNGGNTNKNCCYWYIKDFKVNGTTAAPKPEPTLNELYNIVFDTKANIDTWTKEGFNADKWDFATLNDRNEGRLALYAYGNGEADSEILVTTYFVSPVIKLGENNTVSFNSTNNYYSDAFPVEKATALAIRTVGGEWVEIPGIKHGTNWVELVLTELQIPAEFNNKEVQFGFKYMNGGNTNKNCCYWYIKDFKVTGTTGATPEPTETVAENIAAFNALCVKDGADVTLKLVNAQVLYVNEYTSKGKQKQEVFVRDATGSVMFYNAGLTVKNGDILNGSVKGSAIDFFGTKEFGATANTDFTTLTITDGEATAEEKTIPEITETQVSNLVIINKVKMISREETDSKGKTHTNYYLVDADNNELAYYNKFHVTDCDAQALVGMDILKIKGIITLHYGKLQLCPISAPETTTNIDCIENVEIDTNAPMYNVSGQKVNANYKGIIIQNGKKFFNK